MENTNLHPEVRFQLTALPWFCSYNIQRQKPAKKMLNNTMHDAEAVANVPGKV